MSQFIDDIMGFNPQDLGVFNEPVAANSYDANIYKTNPKLSKSEDGHYRSKLRVLYNPLNIKESIARQATYAMNDENGFFMVKSKLGNGDKDCPIFKSWKALWFSGDEKKKAFARQMYDKTESQWVLVQILEDDNQPEMVGQIKIMKLPKAIYAKMEAKMNPSAESKKTPVAVMDYLMGLPLEMDVTPGPDDPQHPERKQREISYDLCEFDADYAPVIKVDGTSLFDDSELETIENYVTAKNDMLKAKAAAKKEAAANTAKELVPAMKELYKKALDYLTENSPNLLDECTYQEWDEATSVRVSHWIEMVADLVDPKTTTYKVWSSKNAPDNGMPVSAALNLQPDSPSPKVEDDKEELPF